MIKNCSASRRWGSLLLLFMFSAVVSWGQCLMVPAPLEYRVEAASLVIEAKVIQQEAVWNTAHNMIFTLHDLEVYKIFKGKLSVTELRVATKGGIVDLDKIEVNPELNLRVGDMGIFTLIPSKANISTSGNLFDAVEGAQGFVQFSADRQKANDVFASYDNITEDLYLPIQQQVRKDFVVKKELPQSVVNRNGARSMMPMITDFLPTTITAGTKSQLTINGSGFGATQGASTVNFRDANAASGYLSPLAVEYISWSDIQIVVEVPTKAGTGTIQVTNGTTVTSGSNLTVSYNISNSINLDIPYEAIHQGVNGFGGYTFEYFTDFANNAAAVADFETALSTWTCETGINWRVGFNTPLDVTASDGTNIVRFDNGAELGAMTIGQCISYSSGCTTGGVTSWYVSELDMTFNDDYSFHYGAGAPGGGEMDFMSIAVHELGHGHRLGHVINTSMVMHYSISAGQQKRTLAADEIAGGNYTAANSTSTSHCSQEMMVANGCGIAPVALFDAGAAATCGSLTFDFLDISENIPTSWAWDIDGDGNTDYTSRNVSHTYPSAGFYEVTLDATNANGTDSYTTIVAIGSTPAAACSVTTTNTGNFGTGIDKVVFNQISNAHATNNNDGTQDFTCTNTTVLQPEGSYDFTVNLRGVNLEFCRIYIDFNSDNSFNDTDERVYNGTTKLATHTGTITLPAAVTGQTLLRMRVVTDFSAVPTSCGPTEYGEAEDYGVYILCGNPVADVTNLSDVTGQCTATAAAPTATDPCDASTVTATTTDPVTYSAQGTYTINWTYSGIAGNSTQQQTVIIDDTTAPVADVTNLPDLNDPCEVIMTAPTATDECDGTITATTTDPTTYNTNGTYTVTWNYTDVEGNASSQTQQVIINDNTAPVANVASLPTLMGSCDLIITPPTATDDCDGTVTATTTDPVTFTMDGTYSITWNYVDVAGNAASQAQSVEIDDVTAPVIICDADIMVSADAACQFTLIDYRSNTTTLTDNCGGTPTVTQSPPIGTLISGTTVITLTADDGNGNTADCTFNIIIEDNTEPIAVCKTITIDLDATGNATINAADLDDGSTDNCSGTLTFLALQSSFDCTHLGSNTVGLAVIDAEGNGGTCNATVIVEDNLAPVPDNSNLPDATDECTVTLTAPTATDNCSGAITGTTTDPLTYSVEGTYNVTWNYEDAEGNMSAQTQTVIINDITNPVITCDGDITVAANAACEFTLLDYTTNTTVLTDNCGGTPTVTQSPAAGVLITGTTEITLTADDGNGNTATCTFNVVIDDTEAPVAVCQNISVSLDGTGNATITAAELDNGSTDNCSTLSFAATQTTFTCANLGANTVTLTVSDANGNSATCDATVMVLDDLAPVADVANLADATDECTVTLTAPTATDNCDGTITATTTDPITYSAEGTYTVTWTYTDANANSSDQTQTVIIDDVTDPVITCDGDITVAANAACEFTLLDYTTNTTALTDNCGGTPTVTQSPAAGALITGTTEITLTADDGNGNTATCTFNIVIDDTEAPTTICQNISVSLDGTGNATITAVELDNGSTDNCSTLSFAASQTTFTCADLGANTVTLTVSDANGNSASCNATVTVLDEIAPVADVINLADATDECTVTLTAPMATDNCGGAITATTTDPITYSAEGTYTVTWTYTDANSNSSDQMQTVIIDDVTNPVIVCDGDITVAANAACEFTLLDYTTNTTTLADNCGGTPTVTQSPPAGALITGTTEITLTADDGNGNTATCTFNVVIDDTEAPTTICQNISVSLDGAGNATITAAELDNGSTDNCSTLSFAASQTTFTCADLGANTVTLTVSDANGNSATCNATVTVLDEIAPVADVANLADATDECTVTLSAPTATDNCGGTIIATTIDPVTYSAEGTYTVTWTYTDASTNASDQTQTVIIDDVTNPVIVCAGDITVAANAACEFTLLDYTTNTTMLTDNCGGTPTVTQSPAVGALITGTTEITLTADDGNGNTATCTFNIVIDDTEAPTAICQTISVSLDGAGNATITAVELDNGSTDNCSTLSFAASQTTFTCADLGANTVTLTVSDANGNSATCDATVMVVDDLAPVADVINLADATDECTVTLTAPTATDICDGTITGTTTDPVTYSAEGTYTVTWTYTDANGNSSNQMQTVIIDDVTNPVIVCDGDIMASAAANCAFTLLDYTTNTTALSDNCGGGVTVTQQPPMGTVINSTTEITLIADDGNGNTAECTFNVIIDDTEAPTVICQDIILDIEADGDVVIADNALDNGSFDNCSAVTFSSSQTLFDCSHLGTNTVTLTVTDANGNSASCTATVTVNEMIAPVADVVELAVVTGECDATVTAPMATDNCSGSVTGTTTDPLTYSEQGTYTVTWTYTDANGNSSEQTQTVIIDDVTNPVIVCDGDITASMAADCEFALEDYTANYTSLTDNCGGTVTVSQQPPMGTIINSTTEITLIADDGNGNIAECTFNVIIEDAEAPTVICQDIILDIEADGDVVISQSALDNGSFDNCSEVTFASSQTLFDCSHLGTNTVTLTVTDANGNSASCTATVTVNDIIAPLADVVELAIVTGECDATITAPTATDNCSGAVTGTTTDPLTYSEQGTYTVTWTYTDANGNSSNQTQTVIVDDTTAPIIECGADVNAAASANCEFALEDYTANFTALTDNCGGTVTVTQQPEQGTLINSTTEVTLIADDGNGNMSECTFNVIVDDSEAPMVICQNIILNIEPDGDVVISDDALDNGSFDNCSAVTFSASQVLFDCSHLGDNTVTLTVTDANGNSASCEAIVTLNDEVAPAPDVESLMTVSGQCEAFVTGAPTATDNCGTVITGVTADPLTYDVQGTYLVTWTYTDVFDNSSTQLQQVIVADTNGPVPDVAELTEMAGDCELTVSEVPTSTDNCSGAVEGTTTDPLTYTEQGEFEITWSYDDGNGNVSTQVQVVIIDDSNAPVADATELIDLTISCGTEVTNLPTATDDCVGEVVGTSDESLIFTEDGNFTITWKYDDGNGNVSTQNQNVTVIGIPETMISASGCGGYDAPDGTFLTTSGVYSFQFPNSSGCDSTVILDLTIESMPTVMIFAAGDSLLADAQGEDLTYQWMDCADNEPIVGATSQLFLPPFNGFYSVMVTSGTCSAESNCFSYNLSGVSDLPLPNDIKVFPNPFLDYLNITFEHQVDDVEIMLFDVQGRILQQQTFYNREKVLFDTETLIGGFYMLQLKIDDRIYRTKLIKS